MHKFIFSNKKLSNINNSVKIKLKRNTDDIIKYNPNIQNESNNINFLNRNKNNKNIKIKLMTNEENCNILKNAKINTDIEKTNN